jgi:hypothetical protein
MDLVGVVEASYALTSQPEEWLTRVVDAARPALDRGLGIVGYCFQPGDSLQQRIGPLIARDVHPEFMDVFARATQALSPEYDRRAHFGGPCSTISQTARDLPRDRELLARCLGPIGGSRTRSE